MCRRLFTSWKRPYHSTMHVFYSPFLGAPVESYTYTAPVPMMMPMYYPTAPGGVPVQGYPSYPAQQPTQQPAGPLYTEEDLKQVKDMFPNMEEEVIKSVLEANRGNKDSTINSLLAMSTD